MKRMSRSRKLLAAAALVAAVAVGGTFALMTAASNSVRNAFTKASVDTDITETQDERGNKVVTVTNEDVSPVYVRARILVSGVEPGQVGIFESIDAAQAYARSSDGAVGIAVPSGSGWTQLPAAGGTAYSDALWYYGALLPGYGGTGDRPATQPLLLGVYLDEDDAVIPNFSVIVTQESVLAVDTSLTAAGDIAGQFARLG